MFPPTQEAVERRKAEMAKRDEEREKVKAALALERAAANAEAQRQAQARIQAAQEASAAIIQVDSGPWVASSAESAWQHLDASAMCLQAGCWNEVACP